MSRLATVTQLGGKRRRVVTKEDLRNASMTLGEAELRTLRQLVEYMTLRECADAIGISDPALLRVMAGLSVQAKTRRRVQ